MFPASQPTRGRIEPFETLKKMDVFVKRNFIRPESGSAKLESPGVLVFAFSLLFLSLSAVCSHETIGSFTVT